MWILRNSSPRSKKHCSLAKSIICQQLIFSEFSYLVYSLSFHTWKTLYVTAVKFNSSVMKNLQTKAVVHQIPGFCSFAFFSRQVFFFFLILVTHASHRDISRFSWATLTPDFSLQRCWGCNLWKERLWLWPVSASCGVPQDLRRSGWVAPRWEEWASYKKIWFPSSCFRYVPFKLNEMMHVKYLAQSLASKKC